jgi:predicted dehydrogenase
VLGDFKNEVEMDISVYRDDKYYSGWKGKRERSGGPLFNLGVHYFDLLLYIFGDAKNVSVSYLDEKTGKGNIIFPQKITCLMKIYINTFTTIC